LIGCRDSLKAEAQDEVGKCGGIVRPMAWACAREAVSQAFVVGS